MRSWLRLSLRARTLLLASIGVGAILLADAAVRLRQTERAGRANLVERAELLATMQAQALSVPLWNLDDDLIGAALSALAQDADFARAVITAPDGSVVQTRGGEKPGAAAGSKRIAVERPIVYLDRGQVRRLGTLRLALDTNRLGQSLRGEIQGRALAFAVLLAAVLAAVYGAFRGITQPLDLLAGALARLAAGERDVAIPARDRGDEVGAVARGLQVFKDTAFRLANTESEYRAVFDNAALGIYRLDARGHLVEANAGLLRIARHRGVASLRDAFEQSSAFYADPLRRHALRAPRAPDARADCLVSEIRRADGSAGWISETTQAIRDAGGAILGYVGTVEDITERRRRDREEKLRIRAAMESAGDAILITDAHATVLFVNPAFATALGYDCASIAASGGLPRLLRDGAAANALDAALRAGEAWRGEAELIARDGRMVPMAIHASAISYGEPGAEGDAVGSVIICTDLSDRRAAEARIRHITLHDPLTGLPNRTLLRDALRAALDGPVANRARTAILCVDLDRFKEINDALGHAAGDLLLQHAAARLRDAAGPQDVVARLGGDQFVIIHQGARQPEAAERLADRLVTDLAVPYDIGGRETIVGASVGIAVAGAHGAEADALLRAGDLALHEAKAAGRGCARTFSPDLDRILRLRADIEHALRRAIAEDALELHYQPQWSFASGAVIGAEALLRWRHPQRGAISPAEFIPVAEESGLIGPLGAWALRTACREAARWPGHLHVAVNLSPAQFRYGDLARLVGDALAASGLAAHRLELEITENLLLQDTDATIATLGELKALGVRIAMDDFGTGYSSLSYLRRMPCDKIKIDQSFVQAIGREPAALALVRSIIGITRGLGIRANAEGVETEEQGLILREEGCDEVQGWHYGRPVPAAVFRAAAGAAFGTAFGPVLCPAS